MKIIKEYLINAKVPEVIINKKMAAYEKHPDIAKEFESWILTKKYSEKASVVVENYTAKKLANISEFLDGEGAFAMLIQLREKPHQALKRIKDGFMLR